MYLKKKNTWGGCLVLLFKQQFSVFKQHYTYFHKTTTMLLKIPYQKAWAFDLQPKHSFAFENWYQACSFLIGWEEIRVKIDGVLARLFSMTEKGKVFFLFSNLYYPTSYYSILFHFIIIFWASFSYKVLLVHNKLSG